jgi:hypothetical protein
MGDINVKGKPSGSGDPLPVRTEFQQRHFCVDGIGVTSPRAQGRGTLVM